MKYYRVLKTSDQTKRKTSILVANELYTEKEVLRYGIDKKHLQQVELNKNNTYFSFGARFESGKN